MRIAQVATLGTPVRGHDAGSIEGVVWVLSQELEKLGHEVTVFGMAGSEHPGGVVETLDGGYAAPRSPDDWRLCEWIGIARAVQESECFDIVHAHNYLWSLPLDPVARAPMLHTTHVMPGKDEAVLRSLFPGAPISAISAFQWSQWSELPRPPVVHHGVHMPGFPFSSRSAGYLCYLGRFLPEKGPLEAVTAARRLGVPIRLAGPHNEYLREVIGPLVDNRNVEYVGWVGGTQRAELLGGADALLYPVQSPEPFGLPLVEAMMCGTPVAAIRAGAVPEIVDEGVTGHLVDPSQPLGPAAEACLGLDRRSVRDRAEERFAATRMAREYDALYTKLLGGTRPAPRRGRGAK